MELWPLTFCDACQFQSVHSTGHTHIGEQDINVLFRARREVPYLPPGCLDLPHDDVAGPPGPPEGELVALPGLT
jgi:hypothetical protein